MSSDAQLQAQHKINQVISELHRILSQSFASQQQSRDLQPDQNSILCQLDEKSIHYQNLVGILAVDTYVQNILGHFEMFNDVLTTLTVHIDNFLMARKEMFSAKATRSLQSSLLALIHSSHKFSPNSTFVQLQNQLLQAENSLESNTIIENLTIKLLQQNQSLKQQLKLANKQIAELESKLTNVLKQQLSYQTSPNNNSLIALKEELARKQEQMQQMNQQFSYQIQKYNTVFDSMKQQILEVKSYQERGLPRQIERLQIELSRLMEDKQRDELIIDELRERIDYLEGSNGYNIRRSIRMQGNRNYNLRHYQKY